MSKRKKRGKTSPSVRNGENKEATQIVQRDEREQAAEKSETKEERKWEDNKQETGRLEKQEGDCHKAVELEVHEEKQQEKGKPETQEEKQQEKRKSETQEEKQQEKGKSEAQEEKQQEEGKLEVQEEKHQEAESSETEKEQKQESEQRVVPWKRILGITLGAALFIVLGIYVGGIFYFQDKFFPNTRINGMDAAHCTVEDIEAFIADEMHSYKLLLKERGGGRELIKAEQIGYRYVSKGEVQGFLEAQNPFTWPASAWKEYEETFVSSAELDEALLEQTVSQLRCLSPEETVAPKDAYMEFHKTTYRIIEEVEGKKVKPKRLLKLLKAAIAAGEKELDLEESNCYAQPSVRKDDKGLNRLVQNLNQYAQTVITYSFGEKTEVLDGSRIKDWLTYDENGNVTLDENQIPIYVEELAAQYDTYNKPRNFKTHDGSFVEVEGGRYGWKIDQEAEAAELLELVKQGAQTERTAIFAQTAVSWENSDLGHSYVEIDLTNQHLWMYIDGIEEVSSDFVSGDMSKGNRRTPPGTFTLYYKTSPAVLKSNTPGDSYESPVTYWMPFNGGIGLHDASWRGSFGGNIYKYNGSHGCINLPTSAAREIYQRIEKGFPIICYYR